VPSIKSPPKGSSARNLARQRVAPAIARPTESALFGHDLWATWSLVRTHVLRGKFGGRFVFAVCRRRILCAIGSLECGGTHSSQLRPVAHGWVLLWASLTTSPSCRQFWIGFVRVAGWRRRLPARGPRMIVRKQPDRAENPRNSKS